MRSWPKVALPPVPGYLKLKPLRLKDSYSGRSGEVKNQQISSYICGITPYDATHLGHAATYVSFDLIHRYLSAAGKALCFTENITDVDDPLLERAKRDGQDWTELAHSQIDLFVSDMTALKVIPPNHYMGVVESLPVIIEMISAHIAKDQCYRLDDDIYLDLSTVPGFPDNLPFPEKLALEIFAERGGDPKREGKHNALDPLLWRGKREGEPYWSAPFGDGRPGWHVECVAIALNTLPDSESTSITIQGGGSDLIFPHHYMTAMQAKALTGKEFATHYIHAGMIGLDGEKMSKSRGNLVFVSKLLEQGVRAEVIRLALISHHYQEDRMWSQKDLNDASQFLHRIEEALSKNEVAPTAPAVQEICDALSDNLDTPRALKALSKWCADTLDGIEGGSAGEMSRALDTFLGLTI